MDTQSTVKRSFHSTIGDTEDFSGSARPLESVVRSFPRYKRAWTLYVSERRLLLMFVDLALLNASLLTAWLLSSSRATLLNSPLTQAINFLVLTILWLVFSRTMDCYNLRRAASPFAALVGVFQAGSITAGSYLAVASVVSLCSPEFYHVQWTFAALCWLFICTFIGAWRLFYALVFNQPVFCCKAIAVGDSKGIRFITEVVEENLKSEYYLYGYDLNSCTSLQLGSLHDSPQVIRASSLTSLVTRVNAREIILSTNEALTDELERELIQCCEQGIRVTSISLLYENITGRVSLDYIKNHWHMTVTKSRDEDRVFDVSKRLFDIALSVVAITFSLPILFALALMIYLDSPGPIFYRQERVGKNGRLFRMIKFRSMLPGAERDNQAVWAKKNDRRVTRVGRIMRAAHLDEMPQFLNILRGDMSFVGPRPERPQFVRQLERQIPLYPLRHTVRPGLTGWAQVKYVYANSLQDSRVKLEYDLYYVKRRSFYLDTLILLKTVSTVLTFKGT